MTGKKENVNPYIIGVPVPPSMFFGYERQVTQFFQQCIKGSVLQPIRILGLRRSGKTSFFKYIGSRLALDKYLDGDLKERVLFVYLDLEYIETPVDFYTEIVDALIEGGNLPDGSTVQLSTAYSFKKWLKNFIQNHAETKIIVLLDEFEKIHANPQFDSTFFSFLRALASMHSENLTWVTASVVDLYTLEKSEKTSPLWNIFRNTPIVMGGLIEAEAKKLIVEPAQSASIEFSRGEINHIHEISGKIPYFIQAVSDAWLQNKSAKQTNAKIKSAVIKELQKPDNQLMRVLTGYWVSISPEGKKIMLDIAVGKHNIPGSPILNSLSEYGLVEEREGELVVSGELLRQFVLQAYSEAPALDTQEPPPVGSGDPSNSEKNGVLLPTINVFIDSSIGQVRQNESGHVSNGNQFIAGRVHNTQNILDKEIQEKLDAVLEKINANPAFEKDARAELQEETRKLFKELDKKDQAEESVLKKRFENIRRMAPDILDVIIASISGPASGFGMVAKKIAEKIKEGSH